MAEQWEGEHGYAPKNHDHDSRYSKLGHTHDGIGELPAHNHDTVYSKLGHVHDYAAKNHNHDDRYSLLDHSHELLDMLPIGTVLWFKSNVTLSNKWTVYTDLIGRYPLGSTSNLGSTVEAGLPNITGSWTSVNRGGIGGTGAAVVETPSTWYSATSGTGGSDSTYQFDASRCSSVYKDDCDTVTPPSVNLIPYIKIA